MRLRIQDCVRRVPPIACGLLLLGCGLAEFHENKGGVKHPGPATLAAFVAETESGSIIDAQTGRGLTAGEYIVASIVYTNEKCRHFFDLLEHFKQDSSLIDKVITAAIASGSPLLAIKGSKEAVAAVTSALSFANQYNKFYADIFAFSGYKEQLMKHVLDSMASTLHEGNWDKYIAKRLTGEVEFCDKVTTSNRFMCSRTSVDLMIARSFAADYASKCSLAHMRQITQKALENTETKVDKKTGAPNEQSPSNPLKPTTTNTTPKTSESSGKAKQGG